MARVSVMVMIGSCKNRIMRKINFKGKMSALDAYGLESQCFVVLVVSQVRKLEFLTANFKS